MEPKNKTLLILPALNEEEAIKALAPEMPKDVDVVVVDSQSTDGTKKAALKEGYGVLDVKYGAGQGSGIRTGMEYFLAGDCRYLVVMDCDYTDNPADIPRMLDFLEKGEFDITMGIRDFDKQKRMLGTPTIMVKRMLSFIVFHLMGRKIRDITTGYWAFTRKTVESLSPLLTENDYAWGYELIYLSWRMGLRVAEQEVDFRRRIGKTKLTLKKRLILIAVGMGYAFKTIRTIIHRRNHGITSLQ
jgi:glycosyltransferase involved in cell wall biosynthesis